MTGNGFRDRRIRPLCHPSALANLRLYLLFQRAIIAGIPINRCILASIWQRENDGSSLLPAGRGEYLLKFTALRRGAEEATQGCTAAGVPSFSPHDLRHRRVSLLHLAGMPWARIGEIVGHDDLMTTARTYTHVVVDEREIDYGALTN